MLTLNSLTMRDFGPYKGEQTISFSRDRGVYIAYGPNGRGKTTLHNAFRYALYGEILRRNRVEQASELANSESRKERGYGSFATVLEFTSDALNYRLTRNYDDRKNPQESILLERDGSVLPQDVTDKVMNQLAPRSVSQFFLFDGELLRKYEALLDNDSPEGQDLEKEIERVLGIPLVSQAREHVSEYRRSAARRLAEIAKTEDETKRLGAALTTAEDYKASYQRSAQEIVKELEAAQARFDELEELLRSHQQSEGLLDKLDSLRQGLKRTEDGQVLARQALNELSPDLWKLLISARAKKHVDHLTTQIEKYETDLGNAQALDRDLKHLDLHSDCPVCHRGTDPHLREQLIAELQDGLGGLNSEDLHVNLEISRRSKQKWSSFSSIDRRLVTDRDKALRDLQLEQHEILEEMAEIEAKLSNIGEDKIRQLKSERDQRRIQLYRDNERHQDLNKKVAEQDASIQLIIRNIRSHASKTDPSVILKEQVAAELLKLFDESITAYRAKLRNKVEQRASEVFIDLAAEPDYRGLAITEGYGLQILGPDNEVVTGRSAGYEHLVALSLIAALQDSAAVRGPVIMDSPFGRLDSDHTAHVVAALPKMARQVVLLAFEGEFDRQEAVDALGANLISEYSLERISVRHTEIAKQGSQVNV
ncbi:AAA family ATPase [Paeniglutamicibacter psychrophenolicus]|uniref:AAA family ATPase n=1 Tax=Paeniglutamicibacter psychrophenolicus TaxID=257454 RepID=UPI002780BE02|nr:AAA family ATPase [Paeniglutamicibacter psychrophenolicus]MDQ0093063.1 DNA sulfur modification protein DndD [Paeniglutamicibacter psychrophenolicus]